ncbi:hypothetical protein FRB90_010183 [Tulasnella sp. 427]|nr:hypothetical protein FRB90_010183 [Tulasnella sp. 427]
MDKNDELAKDLGAQTSRLMKLLQRFNTGLEAADHESLIAERINDLHGLLLTSNSENADSHKEEHQLLDRLGDGKYGARGNTLDDILCYPGTRVAFLRQIDCWIQNPSSNDRVLWIRGMAGRGKSTIASTVVHNWKATASCAIFHFRRGQTALNSRVACALARQLGTTWDSVVKAAVLDALRRNRDIADKLLEEQFETLLVSTLSKLSNHPRPILIVIDALDESDDLKDSVDLVQLIRRHSTSLPANVRFLLTCRPEGPLLSALEPYGWWTEDLDSATDVSNDLEMFIHRKCEDIRDSQNLPGSWPSPEDIKRLVEMSQGLFQWARTAINHIRNGSPMDRLRMLLKHPEKWRGLDELYLQILEKAFHNVELDDERQELLRTVVGSLVVAPVPISLEVIAGLCADQELLEGTEQPDVIPFLRTELLADLASLLFIPTSPNEPVLLMHASIRDLLISKSRCKGQLYYIDSGEHHRQLAGLCLAQMVKFLKTNIYDLSKVWESSSEIRDTLHSKVSKAVQYGCIAWSAHFTKGHSANVDLSPILIASFKVLSETKLMAWLEVMSVVGATPDAIRMAKDVLRWLSNQKHMDLKSLIVLWNDAQRFIAMFADPIAFGPLQIYSSALPSCPRMTLLWKYYGNQAAVRVVKGEATTWPSNLWTRHVGAKVTTVVFSPDGRRIAVGTSAGSIHLKDASTGSTIGKTLEGHRSCVKSICFSPNGKVLASGSDDGTVRLWDSHTGDSIGSPLNGHQSWIESVCFSPKGQVLASGSDDETIQLWNADNGAPIGQPLRGHAGAVTSVCFSPDGETLVSGSIDKTIRVWNAHTRQAISQPFQGHRGWIHSVSYSPNDHVLASGSYDETIRLWNADTGDLINQPLKGHDGWVTLVCFSCDGKVLLSGSDDKTIRFWDTRTGDALGQPLVGHAGPVNSVCFSPDGETVASGSDDGTIRIWDSHVTTSVSQPVEGHSGWVDSVCISPDGKILASTCTDKDIQLWDTQTGETIGQPLKGHRSLVKSVCFSPDGKILASGSSDMTIRLWDTPTGNVAGQPLEGHSSAVISLAFSPSGDTLASGSSDETVRLWHIPTRTAVGVLTGHYSCVTSVSFSPDGQSLASTSIYRTITFSLDQVEDTLKVGNSHVAAPNRTSFSPDSKTVATRLRNRMIQLQRNIQCGATIGQPLEAHVGWVNFSSLPLDGDEQVTFLIYSNMDIFAWDNASPPSCIMLADALQASPSSLLCKSSWEPFTGHPFLWHPSIGQHDSVAAFNVLSRTIAVAHLGKLVILDISRIFPPYTL